MKILAAIALVLIIFAAGCIGPPAKSLPLPANEPETVPVTPEPDVVKPIPPTPFNPASACGTEYRNVTEKVYSVRPCGQGDYVILRECCGAEPVAYVKGSTGGNVTASASVVSECLLGGTNSCKAILGTAPIACPAAEITECANYTAPVCTRIVNKSGTGWFDFENNCQACMRGRVMGNDTAYIDGTCDANNKTTRADIETEEWNKIYRDLIGKEIVMFAQHYGLASRIVTLTVTKEDVKSVARSEFNGQPAWFVTISRDMEGIPRTVEVYYSEDGSTWLGQAQTQ